MYSPHPKLTLPSLSAALGVRSTRSALTPPFVFFGFQRRRRWRPPHREPQRKKTKWTGTDSPTSRRNPRPRRREVTRLLKLPPEQRLDVSVASGRLSGLRTPCDRMSRGLAGAQPGGKGGANAGDEIYISKIKCHLGSRRSWLSSGLIR